MKRIAKINLVSTRGYGKDGQYYVEYKSDLSSDAFTSNLSTILEGRLNQEYNVIVEEVAEDTPAITAKEFAPILNEHYYYAWVKRDYEYMCLLYEVHYRGWDDIHCVYSPSMFCQKNRRSLISEYLAWEEWAERAKPLGIVYYHGIDEFLEEYKDAVHSRVTLD